MFFFFLLHVFFCSVCVCVCLFFCFFCSACFCFSLENDATHAKHAQACLFCSAFVVIFLRKTETFLKSVHIRTGKREVFCKKRLQPMFFSGKPLSFSRKLHSARGANKKNKKKTRPGVCVCVCVCFFLLCVRSPPRSLTHSLAYPWLLGGNNNLKQHLSFIKVL